MLERLVEVADLAARLGLALVPTLFTGHMSGVNWIPAWALGGSDGDRSLPSRLAAARWSSRGLRNWYADPAVADAQALLAAEAAAALAGHDGALGVGSRQRELELRDPAEPASAAPGSRA